ncbi:lysophospholipid acyltransferase family protein [Gordonia zhaorongruii]|uniref:lysophospholipid acyltransferase family protein n=1 Tax=Gordonia zhaorongruii TaxID=2597659 RepID=UPI00104FDDE2|nr:lysophospholipid acyltransferase family protein [Gordonia zhaorongruii]
MERVYRALEATAGAIFTAQAVDLRDRGLANIPASGGGVVVVNHTSYTDFIPVGLVLRRAGRRARFLVKSELTEHAVMRYLVKRTRSVPVDRSVGADAYRAAVDALRSGELIAVYPEATLSRSFELKEFKSGAVRMAAESGAPVIPVIVWGAQRQWSKGTRRRLGRHRLPIHVEIGSPVTFAADTDPHDGSARLRTIMEEMLHRVQADYPDAPAGADWVPARLGGAAPTSEEALVIEDSEARAKAVRRAAKRDQKGNRG